MAPGKNNKGVLARNAAKQETRQSPSVACPETMEGDRFVKNFSRWHREKTTKVSLRGTQRSKRRGNLPPSHVPKPWKGIASSKISRDGTGKKQQRCPCEERSEARDAAISLRRMSRNHGRGSLRQKFLAMACYTSWVDSAYHGNAYHSKFKIQHFQLELYCRFPGLT